MSQPLTTYIDTSVRGLESLTSSKHFTDRHLHARMALVKIVVLDVLNCFVEFASGVVKMPVAFLNGGVWVVTLGNKQIGDDYTAGAVARHTLKGTASAIAAVTTTIFGGLSPSLAASVHGSLGLKHQRASFRGKVVALMQKAREKTAPVTQKVGKVLGDKRVRVGLGFTAAFTGLALVDHYYGKGWLGSLMFGKAGSPVSEDMCGADEKKLWEESLHGHAQCPAEESSWQNFAPFFSSPTFITKPSNDTTIAVPLTGEPVSSQKAVPVSISILGNETFKMTLGLTSIFATAGTWLAANGVFRSCIEGLKKMSPPPIPPPKVKTHVPYTGYPEVLVVPQEKRSWNVTFPGYNPTEYTSYDVNNPPSWADPNDVTQINLESRQWQDSRFSVDSTTGKPLNPVGRTGVSGRGKLGKWGPNDATDSIKTRVRNGKLQVRVGNRQDSLKGLTGGGFTEGQAIANSARETAEEEYGYVNLQENPAKANEEGFDANANTQILDNVTRMLKDCSVSKDGDNPQAVWRGPTKDKRDTDNAWVRGTTFHYHLGAGVDETTYGLQKARGGDDIQVDSVQWIDITPQFIASADQYIADHPGIVKAVINQPEFKQMLRGESLQACNYLVNNEIITALGS